MFEVTNGVRDFELDAKQSHLSKAAERRLI